MLGVALSIMAALALLTSDQLVGRVAPLIALLAGALIALRFGWAAYTGNIPPWMASFFELGE
jgi:hypothetical protein